MEFIKTSSPHIRRKDSLFRMMLDVLIALLPVVIASFIFYPLAALRNILVSLAVMEGCEAIYALIRFRIKVNSGKADGAKYLDFFNKENIITTAVSAMIYALIMPTAADVPGMIYFYLIVGAVFGLVVGKHVFGGIGKNIFNPAAVGMAFAKIAFGSHYVVQNTNMMDPSFDISVSGGTPLAGISIADNSFVGMEHYSLLDMFLGNIPGLMGEICKIAILLGLAYMIVRSTIDWRIPLAYIGSFAVLMLMVGGILTMYNADFNAFKFTAFEVLSGGLLFAATFMATDPVTSPIAAPGRVMYGIALGVLTATIRLFGSLPEGVVFSILLANMITPLIDYKKWFSTKFTWKNILACALLFVIPAIIIISAVVIVEVL